MHSAFGDIFRHNAACTNHSIAANTNITKNRYAITNIYIITDLYNTDSGMPVLIFRTGIMGKDFDIGRDAHIIPNSDQPRQKRVERMVRMISQILAYPKSLGDQVLHFTLGRPPSTQNTAKGFFILFSMIFSSVAICRF